MKKLYERFSAWRIERLFLTPKEARAACEAAAVLGADEERKRMQETYRKFNVAIAKLTQTKVTFSHARRVYNLTLSVDARSLETEAGDAQGASAVGMSIAHDLLTRHRNTKKNAG